MRRKNVINFIEMKQKIGSILIWIMLVATSIFALEVYADTIVGGTEKQIANEKTIVRTSSQISRGSSSNNIIEVGTLENALEKYAGSGTTTVSEQSSTILLVTFSRTGNQYEVDINRGPLFEKIGIIPPYIPVGYEHVEGTDLDKGFVIEDENGNQFVWVEVPRTTTVYPTAGLEIKNFTTEEFDKIEADLHTYTSTYRNGTTYTDTWSSEAATGLAETEYNTLKKKMLKSIYKNGGFYVGRYETGIDYSEGARTEAGETTQTPVIKQNAYPYNYVTTAQSQGLAESFKTTGYETSLMFGVQWDLMLKHIELSGEATVEQLKTDSTSWGNYKNSTFNITDTSAKYYKSGAWNNGAFGQKDLGDTVMLSTGASDTFKKQNIYDIAGNCWEWTIEFTSNSDRPVVARAGCFASTEYIKANFRGNDPYTQSANTNTFRIALYKDEGTYTPDENNQPPYIPEGYTAIDGTMQDGFVIADSLGNQYVWIEVPKTSEVYPTAGLLITEFSKEDFSKIENDLQAYTTVYRNGTTYVDQWSSYEATGLTRSEYNTQKKKMLKSIYKNGGFYVGRYETGYDYSETVRTAAGDTTQTPVIRQNSYPYNYVTTTQAQALSTGFATDGYTSSLMFGVQWDLVLKYLEEKGVSQADLITDSTSIGNYLNSTYTITNGSTKYSTNDGGTWTSATYSKSEGTPVLITTGAIDEFGKQNIYDFAGNIYEFTLEYSSNTSEPATVRSGAAHVSGSTRPAATHYSLVTNNAGSKTGFRVALYKDEEIIPSTYTITYNNNGKGTAPEPQTATEGIETTLSTETLTATGYTFLGWATSSTATTAEYAAGASYTGYDDVTLYAVWEQTKCTLTLSANGGLYSTGDSELAFRIGYGSTATMPPIGEPTRDGYTFLGYSTSSTATTAQYTATQNIRLTSDLTLYAVWKQNATTTYTITLNANGGNFTDGTSVKTITVNAGDKIGNVANPATRAGYTAKGWSTNKNATTAQYTTLTNVTPTSNMTFYFIWGQGGSSIAKNFNDTIMNVFEQEKIYIKNKYDILQSLKLWML